MKNYVKFKNFCGIVMPSKKDNILEFNQYIKSDKTLYIIYPEICANNPEKS